MRWTKEPAAEHSRAYARTRASSKSETAADGRGAACARAIRQFRSGFRVHDGRTRWTSVDARRQRRRRELAGGARPARAPSPSPPSPPVRVQRETTANDRGGKRAIVFRPSPDVTSRSRSRSRAVRVARVPRRHRSVETSRPFASRAAHLFVHRRGHVVRCGFSDVLARRLSSADREGRRRRRRCRVGE